MFIDKKNQANVGQHVDQIWRHALVQPSNAFIPPSLFHTVDGARVLRFAILQSGSNHLVRIS